MEPPTMWAKWRKDLADIGGWDNELISVPAGAVRKMIELGERQQEAVEFVAYYCFSNDRDADAMAMIKHAAAALHLPKSEEN